MVKKYADGVGAYLKFSSLIGARPVEFYAFVTSFTQTFTSNWNKESVYGRNDPIGTFQGTERTISVGWDVPSGNIADAKANLSKMGTLVKLLYPAYSTSRQGKEGQVTAGVNALSLSKSPLVRLSYGNLITNSQKGQGLLGWISSVSWNPVIDMGMFTGSDKKMYPKVVSLSIEFNVLHEHDLGILPGGGGTPAKFPFGG